MLHVRLIDLRWTFKTFPRKTNDFDFSAKTLADGHASRFGITDNSNKS